MDQPGLFDRAGALVDPSCTQPTRDGREECGALTRTVPIRTGATREDRIEPLPPFQAGSHTSYLGAVDASGRVSRQCAQILGMYRVYGSLTDAQMADMTGIERSTVIPRRRELQRRGLVTFSGHHRNALTGILNKTYGLVRR